MNSRQFVLDEQRGDTPPRLADPRASYVARRKHVTVILVAEDHYRYWARSWSTQLPIRRPKVAEPLGLDWMESARSLRRARTHIHGPTESNLSSNRLRGLNSDWPSIADWDLFVRRHPS